MAADRCSHPSGPSATTSRNEPHAPNHHPHPDPEPAQPSPTDAPSSDGADADADADTRTGTGTDTRTGTGAGAGGSDDAGAATSDGGEIIDQLDDGMGGGVDDVDVDVEGANIRLTLNEGSTDDGIMDCLIAGALVEEGRVVTMIYPDGDVACDE